MAKKDKRREKAEPKPTNSSHPLISKRGWKVIGFGILIVIAGYIVLSFTDPRGQNLASKVSPFLLIGGYTLIGVGIITKDPTENPFTPTSQK